MFLPPSRLERKERKKLDNLFGIALEKAASEKLSSRLGQDRDTRSQRGQPQSPPVKKLVENARTVLPLMAVIHAPNSRNRREENGKVAALAGNQGCCHAGPCSIATLFANSMAFITGSSFLSTQYKCGLVGVSFNHALPPSFMS